MVGRTALVTGASRGIGEAVATRLTQEGAEVILVSRRLENLKACADRVEATAGRRPRVAACNVGDMDAIAALMTALDDDDVMVDALVNNAATNPYFGPMIGLEWGAWDKTFDVNVKGTFALSREVARRLMAAQRPGAIVNVSSVYGLTGAMLQGIYGLTKAAVLSMTRTCAQEWGPAGVRVNAVAPGLVDTRFAAAIVDNPALESVFSDRSMLKRHAQPVEIAGAVAYLLSDDASFVTGVALPVDGGYTAA